MLRVGLTGGLGSGKSTVAAMLREFGAEVIESDELGRAIMEPGQAVFNEIVRVFCGDCGTPLYVQVATRPDLVGLRVCTLDDPSWFRPEADIFMRSAQPWDHDETGVPKYDGYPSGRSYPIVTGP